MRKEIDWTRFHDVTIFSWKSSPRKLCAIVNIGLPVPAQIVDYRGPHGVWSASVVVKVQDDDGLSGVVCLCCVCPTMCTFILHDLLSLFDVCWCKKLLG